jgi:hypothetical protein
MQVYSPVSAIVQTLPDNIQSFILPLVTQAAITGYMNRLRSKQINSVSTKDYEQDMQDLYEDILDDQYARNYGYSEDVDYTHENDQDNTPDDAPQQNDQDNTPDDAPQQNDDEPKDDIDLENFHDPDFIYGDMSDGPENEPENNTGRRR